MCYRHLGRETWVRCARCERPICPDCMKPAAVGFQCSECIAAGAASIPMVRTRFGGAVTSQPGQVTLVIIGLCVVAFGWQQLTGAFSVQSRFAMLGLASDDNGQLIGIGTGQYYRLLTAAFLHASVLHLLVNMYALYIVGPMLEASLGRLRYITLYLVCAFGGSAASYAFNDPRVLGVGASGAIFGLFGAVLVTQRKTGAPIGGVIGIIGLNLVIGFVQPGIDWRAHLGGLVIGLLVGAGMVYAPKSSRDLVQAGSVAVAIAMIVGLVMWRTADLHALLGL